MKAIFLLLTISFYQEKQLEFIDYFTVLKDIKQNGKASKYYSKLDYESMLLLDKACFSELLEINPDFLQEKSIDTILLFAVVPDNAKSKIKTNESNICNFILSQKNQDGRFINPSDIYIKDKRKAVYNSSNSSSSSKYRLTMMQGFVVVELIYQEIE